MHNNPLINDLSHLSINEVEEKIIILQRRYFQANNPSVQSQLLHYLNIYKEEMSTRRAKEMQKQRQIQDGDENSLDNLINIS
jgi:hypothetical protein